MCFWSKSKTQKLVVVVLNVEVNSNVQCKVIFLSKFVQFLPAKHYICHNRDCNLIESPMETVIGIPTGVD